VVWSQGFGGKGAGGKPETKPKGKGKVYTMKDVAQHCVPEDAWIVINNQVCACVCLLARGARCRWAPAPVPPSQSEAAVQGAWGCVGH
jgi:hypothetical protein